MMNNFLSVSLVTVMMALALGGCDASIVTTNSTQASQSTQPVTSNTQTQIVPATVDGVHIKANTPFSLQVGQTAVFDPNGLQVQFVDVKEDSRCPSDVECFWSGEGVVHVITSGANLEDDTYLTTLPGGSSRTSNAKNMVNIGGDGGIGYFLQLVDLQPYRKTSKKIAPGEYKATFKLIIEN